jgi:hypothetical protein
MGPEASGNALDLSLIDRPLSQRESEFMHPHIRGTGAGDDPTYGQYRRAMMRAIDDLVKDRFMLCEDADDRLAAKGNPRRNRPCRTASAMVPRSDLQACALPVHEREGGCGLRLQKTHWIYLSSIAC